MGVSQLLLALGFPLGRNIVGWAHKALEDGILEQYELKRLVATVLRTLLVSVSAYYTIPLFGIDVDLVTTTAAATLFDYLYSLLKKR